MTQEDVTTIEEIVRRVLAEELPPIIRGEVARLRRLDECPQCRALAVLPGGIPKDTVCTHCGRGVRPA